MTNDPIADEGRWRRMNQLIYRADAPGRFQFWGRSSGCEEPEIYLNALEDEVKQWRELAGRADVLVRHLPATTWLWEQKDKWLADYDALAQGKGHE